MPGCPDRSAHGLNVSQHLLQHSLFQRHVQQLGTICATPAGAQVAVHG